MPSKPKIPEYLTLLKTIKQLCSPQSVSLEDKNQLLDWAYKTKLLQLQFNGNAISKPLVDSLNQLLMPVTEVIVRLNSLANNDKQLNEFHQQIDDFYQPLHQLTDTLENEALQEQWQKAVAEDCFISVSKTCGLSCEEGGEQSGKESEKDAQVAESHDLDVTWMFENDQSPFLQAN